MIARSGARVLGVDVWDVIRLAKRRLRVDILSPVQTPLGLWPDRPTWKLIADQRIRPLS